jgi:hypothetical protein
MQIVLLNVFLLYSAGNSSESTTVNCAKTCIERIYTHIKTTILWQELNYYTNLKNEELNNRLG